MRAGWGYDTVNGEQRSIGTRELAGVFWRSFLLQASWSFERMQSLGFAFAMLPVLRKLNPDAAERASRVRDHMTYFNTQPYMASFVLGAASRREKELAAGRRPPEDIAEIKTALAGPLGALGDGFFWGGIKPLAAVLAVTLL
ncbi:MAG TPA: PTS system mannose/fructose/sorbose family transporter subunit IID, partial [Nitrospirota bacterium]|nr:PTS system mannose/fructose/sorbose family transporter subunit IID [Nitrospirota bacterium]